jgi:peptide/nickel transport system substrate-binding protein
MVLLKRILMCCMVMLAMATGIASAAAKDSLAIGQYGDTPNFDTHNNLNDNGMRINMVIYDPLVRMDNSTYEIKPCVAESWSISSDGREYTFNIKKGIKFTDGSDMKISDVIFSLKRGMEMPMAVPSFARVKGVDVAGDNAVKVTLDGPYPEFLFAMSLPTAGILSEEAFNKLGDKFATNPVTTGPYTVKSWKVGESVMLEANEYYHMGVPPIKNVEYRVIADPNSAVISLESGHIDAYVGVPQSSFKRIEGSGKLTLHKGSSFSLNYIQPNCDRGIFKDVRARQALALATDKESILYGILEGDGRIIDTFALPEYLGFTDEVEKYPYDLDRAKSLFAETGVEGVKLDIVVNDARGSKIAQVVQNSLAEIEIEGNIRQLERSAFDATALAGDFDIIIDGATFTAPTIDEAIYSVVHSSQMEVRNYGRFSDQTVDKLFDDARVTLDESERTAKYRELLVRISRECPIIPTTWNTSNIAADSGLKGVTANPWSFYNVFDFSW